jgi:hypothetical protein
MNEAQRLLEILRSADIRPDQLEAGFPDFSNEAKNELARQLARMLEPPPEGRVLARLLHLITEKNRQDVVNALILNLHSPDPAARKTSLYGLHELEHLGIEDFALSALRDESDQVVTAACQILMPKAQQSMRLWNLLHDFYTAHRPEARYYMAINLLKANKFDQPWSDADQ